MRKQNSHLEHFPAYTGYANLIFFLSKLRSRRQNEKVSEAVGRVFFVASEWTVPQATEGNKQDKDLNLIKLATKTVTGAHFLNYTQKFIPSGTQIQM